MACILIIIFIIRRPTQEEGAFIFGQLAIGFTLASIFAAGITIDKDGHTVGFGWREPRKQITFNTTLLFPPPSSPFSNTTAHFLACKAQSTACKDIQLSLAGSIMYVAGAAGVIAFFPYKLDLLAARRRKSKREYAEHTVALGAITLFWVGLVKSSLFFLPPLLVCVAGIYTQTKISWARDKKHIHILFDGIKYEVESWDSHDYADLILFGLVATFMTAMMVISLFIPSRALLSFNGFWGSMAVALGGCTFGYTARIRDLGLRSADLWGKPFSQEGPTPCKASHSVQLVCNFADYIIIGAGLWTMAFMLYFNTTVRSAKEEMISAISHSEIIEPQAFYHKSSGKKVKRKKRGKKGARDEEIARVPEMRDGQWYQMTGVSGAQGGVGDDDDDDDDGDEDDANGRARGGRGGGSGRSDGGDDDNDGEKDPRFQRK